VLTLGGTVKNNGVISAQGQGHGGGLSISAAVTLSGTGTIAIGGPNPWDTSIGPAGSGAVLTNDSTFAGQGNISVALVNGASGVIDAMSSTQAAYAIYLNSGTADTNDGLLEATSSGTLNINDTLTNDSTGKIEANSGAVNVNANISNAGLIAVNGAATLTIASGVGVTDTGAGKIVAYGGTLVVNGSVTGDLDVDGGVVDLTQSNVSNNVDFLGGGKLELNQSQSYTGQISGFSKTGANRLDLTDIGFVTGATTATFVEDSGGTSGVLTVTNGSATANITLVGNYSSQTLTTGKDFNGDTIVIATTPPGPNAVHAFAGAMAAFGADSGASVSTAVQTLRTDHPLLAVSGRAA
jgi:hypothetical protein